MSRTKVGNRLNLLKLISDSGNLKKIFISGSTLFVMMCSAVTYSFQTKVTVISKIAYLVTSLQSNE